MSLEAANREVYLLLKEASRLTWRTARHSGHKSPV